MKPVIEICMGSSCFSRGNAKNLERVEKFLKDLKIEDQVELKGRLCAGTCASGPCITINTRKYTKIHPDAVEDLLRHHLKTWNPAVL